MANGIKYDTERHDRKRERLKTAAANDAAIKKQLPKVVAYVEERLREIFPTVKVKKVDLTEHDTLYIWINLTSHNKLMTHENWEKVNDMEIHKKSGFRGDVIHIVLHPDGVYWDLEPEEKKGDRVKVDIY